MGRRDALHRRPFYYRILMIFPSAIYGQDVIFTFFCLSLDIFQYPSQKDSAIIDIRFLRVMIYR